MGLREIAEADLAVTVEDLDGGFGWPITLTDPDGFSGSGGQLVGLSNDISQIVDPDTGLAVSGRLATASIRISSITGLGFTSLPVSIASTMRKPWLVAFDDINGNSYTFKVRESNPDRALGLIVLILEAYI